jgi:hypothetical protein
MYKLNEGPTYERETSNAPLINEEIKKKKKKDNILSSII